MIIESPPPLQVSHLIKAYQRRNEEAFQAVSDISFSVGAGECFGLLGPNGAGKSSTIHCITGFYPATEGKVLIEGHDVYRQPKLARKHLGVCPQEDTLDSDFKVLDQLIRHATYFKIPVTEGRRRAIELLKKFHLEDKSNERIENLSGGMKRRLQVARALISNPKVLVLDEPSTGLDPKARRSLWEILMEYRREKMAILLSTHYMEEAERLCDRIAILSHGKILDIDTPGNLIVNHISENEITEEIRPGTVWKRPPNLEDVYLKVTGTKLQFEGNGK